MLIFYYRYRTQSILEHNDSLEKAVNKKTIEMENLMEEMVTQERLATIGKVSASIAHELRNPLGAVEQSVFYLRSKINEPEKIKTHLDLISNELVASNRVIDDLLEIAKIKKTDKKYSNL